MPQCPIDFFRYILDPDGNDGKNDDVASNMNEEIGEVYGDMYEDPEFQQAVENPYYGHDVEIDSPSTGKSTNKSDKTDRQIITCTKNVYYEM